MRSRPACFWYYYRHDHHLIVLYKYLYLKPLERVTCQHGESDTRPAKQHQDQIYQFHEYSEPATFDLLNVGRHQRVFALGLSVEGHNHSTLGVAWTSLYKAN